MNIKSAIKRTTKKYFGYDLSNLRIKLGEDFRDQKKLLRSTGVTTIFDVGANVGQTTRRYKKLFPKADIYGFEPYREVYDVYEKTFADDPLVHPIAVGLSDKSGEAKFFLNDNHYTNSLLPNAPEFTQYAGQIKSVGTSTITTDTLDSFCKQKKIEHIDILKMDVQGGELLVLQGAQEMLSKKSIDLIYTEIEFVALYQDQPLFETIKGFLENYGYRLYKTYIVSRDADDDPVAGDAIFLNPSLSPRL